MSLTGFWWGNFPNHRTICPASKIGGFASFVWPPQPTGPGPLAEWLKPSQSINICVSWNKHRTHRHSTVKSMVCNKCHGPAGHAACHNATHFGQRHHRFVEQNVRLIPIKICLSFRFRRFHSKTLSIAIRKYRQSPNNSGQCLIFVFSQSDSYESFRCKLSCLKIKIRMKTATQVIKAMTMTPSILMTVAQRWDEENQQNQQQNEWTNEKMSERKYWRKNCETIDETSSRDQPSQC